MKQFRGTTCASTAAVTGIGEAALAAPDLSSNTLAVAQRRQESIAVGAVAIAFSAIYALLAGQDTNWDLKNYHIYSVHAWLNGETFRHLAPAQIQSWLSPLPHVLQVLLIESLRPAMAGTVMGALAAINGWLVWLLVRRLQGWSAELALRLVAGVVVIVSLSGSMFLSFLGTTWAEYVCSPFVLIALIVLVPGEKTEGLATNPAALLLSGLAMGAACGLKLTNLVYAIGLGTAITVVAPSAIVGWSGLAYVAGGALGFLGTGGFWAVQLWHIFGNPIFPFFNGIFASPMFERTNFVDARFIPQSLAVAAVTYPFEWLLGRHPTSELPFREARFALVAVLTPIAIAVAAWRAWHTSAAGAYAYAMRNQQRLWFIMLFFGVSYVVWLKQFAIQRYALPLELLAGIVLAIALHSTLREPKETLVVLALLSGFIVSWARPTDWSRVPYGREWFQISAKPSDSPVMYVLLGYDPMAYIIPFMPKQDQFVRISGNLPLVPDRYLGREANALIVGHSGPIRTLSVGSATDDDQKRLAAFGLAFASPERCDEITTTMDRLRSCDLVRLPVGK